MLRPGRTRFPRTLLPAVLAALAALCVGCGLLPEEEDILPPPLITPKTVVYRTQPVMRGDLVVQENLIAYLAPRKRVLLSFQPQGGRLKAIHAVPGRTVKAGDLVAELDSGTLAAEFRIQELEVQKSALQLKQLKASGADATTVRIAEISLEQLRIRLDLMEAQLDGTRLRSPIDGEVLFVGSYAVGDLVGAYETVAIVADPTDLLLVSKGTDAARLPLGASVSIAFGKVSTTGTVVSNGSTLADDPDASMHEAAIIAFDAGMPEGAEMGDDMKVVYLVDQRTDVLILPRSAVNLLAGRRYVDLLVDGARTERDVEVGLMTDTECEIVQGLEEGDLVIVD